MALFKLKPRTRRDDLEPMEVEDVLDLQSQPVPPAGQAAEGTLRAETPQPIVLPEEDMVEPVRLHQPAGTPAVDLHEVSPQGAAGDARRDGGAPTLAQARAAARARDRARTVPVDVADKPDFAETQVVGMQEVLIGEILSRAHDLRPEQVKEILAEQERMQCKFGEAAVALGLVKASDVMWALSKQYQYAVAPDDQDASQRFARLDDELVVGKHPFSAAAEMVRDIRSQLLESVLDPDSTQRLALAITSPNSGDGKSWFAANLALSFSQLGSRTLLIDADLRSPRLHRMFGLDDDVPGLSGMLAGRTRPNVLRPVRELRSLYLLPGGPVPPNPLELLQGRLFTVLMRQLLTKFEHVIVDTPAAEHGADCRVVGSRCGAALIIGRRGRSRMDALHTLAHKLGKGNTRIAGVVLNDA